MACWTMASLMYGITSVTLLKNEIHNYLIYRIFNPSPVLPLPSPLSRLASPVSRLPSLPYSRF